MKSSKHYQKKIKEFADLLESVIPAEVTGDAYCQKYLSHLLDHRYYYLQIYAFLVKKMEQTLHKSLQDTRMVDYGSGNGLLGIFAAYCGCKEVMLHEQDAVFLESSQKLASILKTDNLHFVKGNETAFDHSLYRNSPDAIVSTDVIEHIYDLDVFLETIRFHFPSCIHLHTTAANASNPMVVHRLKKLQRMDEFEGSDPASGDLAFAQQHPSFYTLRKEIITACGKQLKDNQIHLLTKLTRGLRKDDIEKVVQVFNHTSKFPQELAHPTNTCHPLTGSWTEQLISIKEYKILFKRHGLNLQVNAGFYDEFSSVRKKIIRRFINRLIKIFGVRLSPFFILIGTPKH